MDLYKYNSSAFPFISSNSFYRASAYAMQPERDIAMANPSVRLFFRMSNANIPSERVHGVR